MLIEQGNTTTSVAEVTMQPTQPLNADQLFFFEHAGYSWDPKTETAQAGRTRVAIALEIAERIVSARKEAENIQFVWEHDDIDSSDFEEGTEPRPLWVCRLQVEGCTAASLGGIDLGRDGEPSGNSDDYSRVVEAELAAEWLEADTKVQMDAFREPELTDSCSFTRQQQAAILAGLRMLQQALHGEAVTVPEHTLTDGGALEPIDVCGIDSLCEMVNHL